MATAVQNIGPSINAVRSVYGLAGTRRVLARTDETEPIRASQMLLEDRNDAVKRGDADDRLREEKPESALDALSRVIADTNDSMARNSHSLRFRINHNYDALQVQVVDSNRDRVIRSIPSEEMLKLSTRMRELAGVGSMVDLSR